MSLTVVQTKRLQGESVLGYLHDAIQARRCCRPQPTKLALQLPTGLVGVLDLGKAHRLKSFLVRCGQSGPDFLLQVGDRAQGNRCGKHLLRDFLHTPFTHAVAARKVRQGGSQTRAIAMVTDFLRCGGPSDFATTGQVRACPWYSVAVATIGGNSIT